MANKTGEEQGDAKKANKIPIRNGYKNKLEDEPCGIFLTKAGICISSTSISCNPKTISIEAKIINKMFKLNPAKALPVNAHNKPIMPKTEDNPAENDNNLTAITEFFFS